VDTWNQLPESVRAEDKLPPHMRKIKGLAAYVCSRQNAKKRRREKEKGNRKETCKTVKQKNNLKQVEAHSTE
jgi:hypothetical protein